MAKRARIGPGITTPHLSLCDEQGRLRGVLSTTRLANGDPTLRLCDSKERERVVIEVDGQTAKIVLNNENGTPSIGMGCDPSMGSSISLYDQVGRLMCSVSVAPDGERHVRLFDKHGVPMPHNL